MPKKYQSQPHVAVLMATYNGANYLSAQIESVLGQRDVRVSLIIRDDRSSDGTQDIAEQFERKYPDNVRLVRDGNLRCGVTRNFFSLLSQPLDADYYAFCDQDDVWQEEKLITAIKALRNIPIGPRLYCSAVEYVDAHLNTLSVSTAHVQPAFENAIVENIAPGCTMVMDAELRRLIVRELPDHPTIHDWWTYLVATAFGNVTFDATPHILYRQHGGNLVGGGFSFWNKWRKRIRLFASGNTWKMAVQAEDLMRLYPELAAEKIDLICRFVAGKKSLAARFRLVFSKQYWRQSLTETLVVRLLILINSY
jgi:glycosyltransferase involved in cell wall biosynthesis